MILVQHPDIERNTGLKFLGYWCQTGGLTGLVGRIGLGLPDPRSYVDPKWSGDERKLIIAYLKNGQLWEGWFGPSYCRFGCDVEDTKLEMGCTDLSDGVYVWPFGFAHYLEEHAIKPPNEFIDHVLRKR